MLRTRFVIAMSLATVAGAMICALAQRAPSSGRLPLDSVRSLGAPRRFRNLTLFPVYNAAARPANTYLTLDEGLHARRVKVREAQGGGDVNTLYVSNTSAKPLYLMAGEVVLGGQQDRCLAKDTIISPGKKGVPITVFCVEHGRWTGQAVFDASAQTLASADIRKSAQEGEFLAERASTPPANGMLAHQTRIPSASIGRAQEEVWNKVAQKNQRFKAAPESGTYREVLNLSGGDARQSIAPYLKALAGSLPPDPHLVGAVAAVNGKVVAADIFGDPALFHKLWPKLLRSYAADAAENAANAPHAHPAVTAAQARRFLLAAADAN